MIWMVVKGVKLEVNNYSDIWCGVCNLFVLRSSVLFVARRTQQTFIFSYVAGQLFVVVFFVTY